MYNVKDNAEAKLQVWLSSLATTLVVELGNGMLFPEAPFIAVLNKRDSDWKIVKSEKVEVTDKDGDQFTVNRGFEWTTPQDFNAWDFFSLFVLARHIQDLQGGIETNAWHIVTLSERVTSAEEAIDELQKAWAIDHLETNLIVAERYTANNNLFAQFTPRAEDCNVAIPVGNVVANTQIHIQRASSTKAWNTVKMKIRRVWEPTTKVVLEIQKATIVNDTNETYRYWNWQVLATAMLPYSTFTDQWQEVTFTFDNEFWGWEESELLSVVVHQDDNIVNASNYYEIASDSTQYSEWFRAVFVNWGSRTYNKMMPYCEGEGLAFSMLCRCDSTRYTVPYDLPLLENASWNCTNGSIMRFISCRNGQYFKLKAHVSCSVSSSYSNRYGYFNIYDWWNGQLLINKQGSINEDIELNQNKSSAHANLLIQIWTTYNWRTGSYSNMNIYTTNGNITKTQRWTLVKVESVANVWEIVPAILTGKVWNEFFEWWKYCEDDKYDLSFSTNGWTNNNCWFVAHADGLARFRIANVDTAHYNYININGIRILEQWDWNKYETFHIKKWDEIFWYWDYSWWNAYCEFYPGK